MTWQRDPDLVYPVKIPVSQPCIYLPGLLLWLVWLLLPDLLGLLSRLLRLTLQQQYFDLEYEPQRMTYDWRFRVRLKF